MLFKPIPGVSAAASFHAVEPRTDAGVYPGVSWLEYRDLRERLRSFRELLAFRMMPLYVGSPARSNASTACSCRTTTSPRSGLRPALGRFLRAGRSRRVPAASRSRSSRTASGRPATPAPPAQSGRRFASTAGDLTIIGVTPRGFQGTVLGLNFDVWLPATLAPPCSTARASSRTAALRGYSVMGALQPNASRAQAQAELDAAMRQLAQAYPETNATVRGEVLPFWQSPRGPQRLLTARARRSCRR